jgi:hypothetical protein
MYRSGIKNLIKCKLDNNKKTLVFWAARQVGIQKKAPKAPFENDFTEITFTVII